MVKALVALLTDPRFEFRWCQGFLLISLVYVRLTDHGGHKCEMEEQVQSMHSSQEESEPSAGVSFPYPSGEDPYQRVSTHIGDRIGC